MFNFHILYSKSGVLKIEAQCVTWGSLRIRSTGDWLPPSDTLIVLGGDSGAGIFKGFSGDSKIQ